VTGPLVLKLGGELLETAESRKALAQMVRTFPSSRPVAIVHGGGRAIDAELERRGVAPKKIDGIRVTDAPTLEAVIAVLAGTANTDVVAALVMEGVRAVGLTGVDAGMGEAQRSPEFGLVGDPSDVDPSLVELLLTQGYVPVIASLGVESGPSGAGVLNVNADVMACRLAAAIGAELVIAGATAGVLDASGVTVPALTIAEMVGMIDAGTATAGMVAKLRASQEALEEGVPSVRLVDGRGFGVNVNPASLPGTTLTRGTVEAAANALGHR
jgi:acetylglutamate kinase